MRLLFVCTGNICRSPMAEALLRAAVARDPLLRHRGIEVRSAGINGLEGEPASEQAVALLLGRGIDLSAHRGRRLSEELVDWADLILVMEEGHRHRAIHLFPRAAGKLALLAEYAGGSGEIADPYGYNKDTYRKCADLLATLMDGLLRRLRSSYGEILAWLCR